MGILLFAPSAFFATIGMRRLSRSPLNWLTIMFLIFALFSVVGATILAPYLYLGLYPFFIFFAWGLYRYEARPWHWTTAMIFTISFMCVFVAAWMIPVANIPAIDVTNFVPDTSSLVVVLLHVRHLIAITPILYLLTFVILDIIIFLVFIHFFDPDYATQLGFIMLVSSIGCFMFMRQVF
jgi:hypothetical protein